MPRVAADDERLYPLGDETRECLAAGLQIRQQRHLPTGHHILEATAARVAEIEGRPHRPQPCRLRAAPKGPPILALRDRSMAACRHC